MNERTTMALTDERKRRFLEVLSETGSVAAACRASASDSHGERAAKSTINDAIRRDPDFAAAVDAAKQAALGKVEEEIVRRAFNPPQTPVVDRNGNVVGYRTETMSADRLLLRIASRLDPESWAEKRKSSLEVSGTIQHQAFAINPELVSRLPRERQEQLIDILDELAAIENGLDPKKAINE